MESFCMRRLVVPLIFMVCVHPLQGSAEYGPYNVNDTTTLATSNNSTYSPPLGHIGFCPNSLRSLASCFPPPPCVPCVDDLCNASQKCCQVQGCCPVCTAALSTPPPAQRRGTCPNVSRLSHTISATPCTNDIDCSGDQKCCFAGSVTECMVPEQT